MSKTKIITFVLLELVAFLFVAQIIAKSPINESLFCQQSEKNNGIQCLVSQKFIANFKQVSYFITDIQGVSLDDKIDSRQDYITTDFFIGATDQNDSRVVLLNVPENNTSYASELVKEIHSLSDPASNPVVFNRSNSVKIFSMLGMTVIFALVVGYGFLKNKKYEK